MQTENPEDFESLIPIWGSGKAAVHHFERGNWLQGSLYAGMAVSDVFLVKALGTIGMRLAVRGLMSVARKEGANLIVKGSVEGLKRAPRITANRAAHLAEKAARSLKWRNLDQVRKFGMTIPAGPGAQLVKINGWWVKRVNPNANLFKRAWATLSIEAQEQALAKLGTDLAPDFFVKNGMLFTRNAGKAMANSRNVTFWKNYVRGSWRMKTILNDIPPRNMGLNGAIFDPALDPLMKAGIWSVPYFTTLDLRSLKWHDRN